MPLASCLILSGGSHYDTDSYRLTSLGTQYFAVVAVLNKYAVNDLNGLDAYTGCTMHKQDSVVARHERKNYVHAIARVLYSM